MLLALREIVERQPSLPLQIGVNAGHVFAGDIGTTFRRNYTVMGDAVNLAARVMAQAPQPGQLLATASVLDSSRTLFETDALEPFFVKGKRRPVTAFSVGPGAGRARRGRRRGAAARRARRRARARRPGHRRADLRARAA